MSLVTVTSATPRIVLVDVPQLLSDVIEEALGRDQHASILRVVHGPQGLSSVIEATRANVLIVGSEHRQLHREIRELQQWRMPPDAVVIPFDASGVVLYAHRPYVVRLGDISCTELIGAIHRSVSERLGG